MHGAESSTGYGIKDPRPYRMFSESISFSLSSNNSYILCEIWLYPDFVRPNQLYGGRLMVLMGRIEFGAFSIGVSPLSVEKNLIIVQDDDAPERRGRHFAMVKSYIADIGRLTCAIQQCDRALPRLPPQIPESTTLIDRVCLSPPFGLDKTFTEFSL